MDQDQTKFQTRLLQDVRERQQRWTRDVTQLMAVVILAMALVITVGILVGMFPVQDTTPIYYLLAAILVTWLGARTSIWR